MTSNYPKYEAYKETGIDWLPQVPEGWEIKKVSWLFGTEKGSNSQMYTKEFCSKNLGEYPVYSGQTANQGIMGKVDHYIYDYSKGGCIFTTTVGAKAMHVSYLRSKFCLSQNCMIIYPIQNVHVKYAYYYFQTLFGYERGLIPDHMQPSFRIEDFYTYRFSVPPMPEQKAIAAFLDEKTGKIDSLLAKLKRQKELLTEKRTALITRAVTRGLNPNEAMKETGIEWLPQVPEHWEVKRLKSAIYLQRGHDLPLDKIVEGKYPIYGSNGVIGYHKDYTSNAPSLTVGRSGSVGEIHYIEEDFWAHNTSLYAKKLTRTIAKYAYYILKTLDIKAVSSGSAVGTLNRNLVHALYFTFPPLPEQKEIIEYIDTQTAKIDLLQSKTDKQIELLKEYRTSLITSAVTGQIKVTDNQQQRLSA